MRQMNQTQTTSGIVLMLSCAVLWSIAGIFIKAIPWNPLVIAGYRSLIASAVVGMYMRARRMAPRFTKAAFTCGGAICLTFLAFITANKLTTAANTIVLQYSAPIFIIIISAVFFGQRFRRTDIIAVGVTAAGVALCFASQMEAGSLAGNLLALSSGVFFALMYVTTTRTDEAQRMTGILLGHLLTAAIGLPMALAFDTPVNQAAIINIMVLGVFQIGIPYILYGLAADRCAPLAACLIGVVEPLLNPVWVMIFNGEKPGPLAILGGAVVLAAVTGWSLANARREAKARQTPSALLQ